MAYLVYGHSLTSASIPPRASSSFLWGMVFREHKLGIALQKVMYAQAAEASVGQIQPLSTVGNLFRVSVLLIPLFVTF